VIGDTFSVNNKTYSIKKDLTFGKYQLISKTNSKLNKIQRKIGETEDPDEIIRLNGELSELGETQLEMMGDFLEQYVGVSQEELNDMSLTEATRIFAEAFKICTVPDVELKKTSK